MDNERIPTMPQMEDGESERIPTMPQMESTMSERIPTMPQMEGNVSERIPTMPQGGNVSGHIPTMPQAQVGADGHIATMPQQNGSQTNVVGGKLLLSGELNFKGDKGNSFIIEGNKVISADSGESQIYGCHKLIGDERLVARVLISVTPKSDPEKIRTRDKVISFLDAMSNNQDSHILPLLDHGVVQISGNDYYVEIYPFCEGGDLGNRKGKITYTELKDEIVPALNKALHCFHNAGLVHRDVKPDNLYKYKEKIVLGDFGITCDLREDGFATDKYKTGTLGYYAPELMSQAAIKASDYYSFGQTIWTLYSGEMMYRNILRRYKDFGIEEQRNQVNFSMLSNTYFGLDEIGKDDEFFELLIRGLLQYDPTHRFDFEKVNRWLVGDKSIAHEIPDFDSGKTFTRAFRLFGIECWEDEDVSEVLSHHWDESIEALYDGRLKDFYASQTYEHARFLDGIMKSYATYPDEAAIPFMNNVGLARTIMYLSKNKLLCWRGSIYTKPEEISDALGNCFSKGELDNDYYGLIYSGVIADWYAALPGQQDEVLAVVNNIGEMLKTNETGANIAYYWLYYLFCTDRSKLQIMGHDNLQDFIKYLLSDKKRIYDIGNDQPVIDSLNFMGLLCAWGYDESVVIFHEAFEKDYCTRYEMFFDFMDQQLESTEDKAMLYNAYSKFGPKAYLSWWKDNLESYLFVGKNSTSLKSSINAIKLNANAMLSEQRETFAKLEILSNQFVEKIEADEFMGSIGIQSMSDDYIFSNNLGCVWQYRFLEQLAPLGFKFYMGL